MRYCGSTDTYDAVVDAMSAKRNEILRDETYLAVHVRRPFRPEAITFGAYGDTFFETECSRKKSSRRDREILDALRAQWGKIPLTEISQEMQQGHRPL